MDTTDAEAIFLTLLAARLERLSADSKWAHRASGVRGQVLRTLELLESGASIPVPVAQALIESAFGILREAAREVA